MIIPENGMIRFCSDCNQQSDEATWSNHYRARLCMDCYNIRCEAEDDHAAATSERVFGPPG